jgi:hypothetical protein
MKIGADDLRRGVGFILKIIEGDVLNIRLID